MYINVLANVKPEAFSKFLSIKILTMQGISFLLPTSGTKERDSECGNKNQIHGVSKTIVAKLNKTNRLMN